MQERLQKILARAGFASRRGAEQLMLAGRVTLNGEIARELGTRADLEQDDVRVDGVRVKAPKAMVYLVLNKPRGVVTTRSDPERRQTVMDLVPAVAGLFPVGRLDVTTEGLILLTNDGAFAERVAHPRYEVPRVYHAKVHGVPDEQALERLRRGVLVEGASMAVDRARVLEADNNAWVEVTLHEGKQHEVKRLLEAVGHPVSKLRRVAIGPVTARGLAPGEFRALLPEEVEGLRRGQDADARQIRKLAPHGGRARARAHGREAARAAAAARAERERPAPSRGGEHVRASEPARPGTRSRGSEQDRSSTRTRATEQGRSGARGRRASEQDRSSARRPGRASRLGRRPRRGRRP